MKRDELIVLDGHLPTATAADARALSGAAARELMGARDSLDAAYNAAAEHAVDGRLHADAWRAMSDALSRAAESIDTDAIETALEKLDALGFNADMVGNTPAAPRPPARA